MQTYRHLLLGGTGFIGTELTKALRADANGKVLCVGKGPSEISLDGVSFLEEDIYNEEAQWCDYPVQNVFILIGQNHQGFDKEQELSHLKKIVEKINAWNESTRIFFFSSVLVYGDTDSAATEETTPVPLDPYSEFKYAGEQYLKEVVDKKHSLSILRLANVYGSPKNKGFIGLLMKAAKEGAPINVNGGGRQTRDYIYVDDVVQAISTVAKAKQVGHIDVLNIASGTSYTLNEVIEVFSGILGRPIIHTVMENSPQEVPQSRINNEKLRAKYGYSPKTFLKEGLQKTWEKYQENM